MANIERYIVRGAGPHKGEWAFFYLDEDHGVFSCYSSYGNFMHRWHARGPETLREFVRDLDFDYFMKKTRGPEYLRFDFDASIKGMKEFIADQLQQGVLTHHDARDVLDEVEEIERRTEDRCSQRSVDLFVDDVYNSNRVYRLYDGDFNDIICNSPDPQCTGFWQVIWPEFLKMIVPTPAPTPEVAA